MDIMNRMTHVWQGKGSIVRDRGSILRNVFEGTSLNMYIMQMPSQQPHPEKAFFTSLLSSVPRILLVPQGPLR
jgi:hypothetical protein